MSITMKKLLAPVLVASLLSHSVLAAAEASVEDETEQPGILAMYTDLLVLRPVGLVTTVVGAVAFVVSLPFTAPTGGMEMAGQTLVTDPALFTFARCLGCTQMGYYRSAEEAEEHAVEVDEEMQQSAAAK